jgi:hypothetical protein
MNTFEDRVAEYRTETCTLLVKRALGLLTIEDMAERLDYIWRALTEEQRNEIETWLADQMQPAPNRDHDGNAVEAEDIAMTPRIRRAA